MNKPSPKSLYIHIPFCAHICKYCDFTKLIYNEEFAKKYVDVLLYELDSYHIGKVDTIYVGGGTPTSLKDADLKRILLALKPLLNDGGEFTVEANVENLDANKLDIFKECGVNRISIGVESTSDKMLNSINRHHTFKDAVSVVSLAKRKGFDNINVDLIYGLPGQSLEDLKTDLDNILSLDVPHISIYSLIVEKGSMFFNMGIKEQDENASREFYELIVSKLREAGYERYEISNFAKNKKYSRHNLTYWKDEEYYGLGLGASGYLNKVRYKNTSSLKKYLAKEFIDTKEEVTLASEMEDYLLTNLRLEKGFKKEDFKKRFGVDFEIKFKEVITSLNKNSLFSISKDSIMLSDEGLILLDFVLVKLYEYC